MILKSLFRPVAFLSICLFMACNTSHKEKVTEGSGYEDSIKTAKAVVDPKIQALLSHFKEYDKFPVVVDSSFIANMNKHDSLGTNEVKMLAKE